MNTITVKTTETRPSFTHANMGLMKKTIAIVLMLIFYVQLWGNNEPQFIEGAEVYVVASSGLTLRELPDAQSRSLGVVEYGTMLTVLNQPGSILRSQKISYVDGKWIKVDYDGIQGYMFDGYLTDLPLPSYDFERCQMDLDLIYPMESWAEHNLGIDTTTHFENEQVTRVIDFYETGDRLVKTLANDIYKVELTFVDTRMMDVYHLLQSMIDDKKLQKTFVSNTTFIEDNNGEMYTIKVNLDNPVKIRKMKNGEIKVKIHSQNYVCAQ